MSLLLGSYAGLILCLSAHTLASTTAEAKASAVSSSASTKQMRFKA